jgi:hypothetical protein
MAGIKEPIAITGKTVAWTPSKTIREAQKNISELYDINIGTTPPGNIGLQSMNAIGKELQRLENIAPGISKLTRKTVASGNYASRMLSVDITERDLGTLAYHDPKTNEIFMPPISVQTKTPQIGETYSWNSVYDDSLYTFRHEYGHAIHWNGLTQEEFAEWFNIYKGKSVDFWEKTVSEYGGSSASELFSESFAEYTCVAYKKGILPKEIEKFFERKFNPIKTKGK